MAGLRCMNLVLYLSPDSILLKSGVADSAVRSIGLTDDKQSQEAGIQTHAAADATIIANSVSYLHPASESQFGDTEEMGLNFMMLCEPEEPQSELHMILSSEVSSRFEEFCGPTLLASDTEPEVSSVDIVDEDVEGCNKTRFIGFVKDNHIDLEGRTTVVDRFTYGIPWLSSKRPVIPDLNAIKKALDADRKFSDHLRESGHLDSYAAVFDKYLQHGIVEVKEEMLRHRTLDLMESAQATHERNTRWGDKLRASPFATNLVMQLEHAQHLAEERELADKREAREEYIRHRDKRNMMFKKAVADSDLVCMLRREKRLLLENERRLAAACTVERTNAKVEQILEERQQKETEMQERLLRRTISP
ncbi:hypothetical protein Pmar_PMAR012501 [Perkinsus marinus ATCC 50983]|uniref:Uncharacterized protein n=1 Tax=Perkinsus marinus (strain ATCC 50983 / TXsc) TaxID=423536 RepID=C5K7I5_PERM5|nr:hypothetical protein Pmar_PMAR012501 [Perkinsus marinus ATCC 50983]EER19520.1 hypothetical protein Pmar_PMAR012501 [Perkinsus marinus ATCC 50983]|eukprot:XP_002787724.1 hypothetical protein Pmar_PMAR012501 [Perkinsus marinus ATCC 50983]